MSATSKALAEGAVISSQIRSYRVERVLGSGGFGITYMATSSVKVGNLSIRGNFAVKEHFLSKLCERDTATSRVHYSNPVSEEVENSKKDFIAEAHRLHKVGIEHPNIVKVNEVFEANNTAYYVMEYLDGESLRGYVKRHGALSEDGMMQIMRPVIDAVGYLHRNRMTHLDVKPDNIMIVKDDDGRIRPVLIDFGLSKHYGADGRPTSTINTLGCSDGYAPTEQYAGITTFSPTADIYALGATMLFCLTGRDPKKSTELRPGEIDSILSGLSLTQPLRDAITRAMATSQYDRTQSVPALFNDSAVGAGCALPADIGIPTARLKSEQRAGHGAAPTEPDKPTRPVTAASSTFRRPLIIGVAVTVLLIFAGILLFTRGCSGGDNPVIVAEPGHARPADFDLACVNDGEYRYFTEPEWDRVTDKSAYTKKGIVLTDFIVALQDLTSEELTWHEAMSRYGTQLPDKDQSEVMANNCFALKRALKAFGGSEIGDWYWAKTQVDSSSAWIVYLSTGYLSTDSMPNTHRVRSVAPVPVVSEM